MKDFFYVDPNGRLSRCGFTIFQDKQTKNTYVVLMELSDNPGMSITNCYDSIATQIYKTYLEYTPLSNIHWIEHYSANSYKTFECEETFDYVTMLNDGVKFLSPEWKRCDEKTHNYLIHSMQIVSDKGSYHA